jgi:hypothetical protein
MTIERASLPEASRGSRAALARPWRHHAPRRNAPLDGRSRLAYGENGSVVREFEDCSDSAIYFAYGDHGLMTRAKQDTGTL